MSGSFGTYQAPEGQTMITSSLVTCDNGGSSIPKGDITKEVWVKPSDGSYFFKKSHAVAYAQAIVVQMNLFSRAKYSFSANQET